jgi:hypothetical protein
MSILCKKPTKLKKKKRRALFFFSKPFLPRGFLFPFSGTILNDKKVVPKGDRGPKGDTLRVYHAVHA